MNSNISYGPDRHQVLDLYQPAKDSFDVFIYFHGGGLEGVGHEVWEYTYNQELLEWILSKKRK